MNIDDILKQPEFKNLDDFLTEEMKKTAGNKLILRMTEIFGEKDNVRNWFYTPVIALGGNRPYDYCRNGKKDEVADILGRIEWGVYS